MKTLAFLLMVFSLNSFAQYDGPAVEACRKYALQELKREGSGATGIVFERDTNLLIERYTRKLGSQFVSSVLTGNGAVVFNGAPSAELAFICLLANDKQPVFFNWLARQNVPALSQCTRDDALRARPRPCLETVLQVTEADLDMAYVQRFQDASAKGGAPLADFRKSNDEWREYRDAECARRRHLSPEGIEPGVYQIACIIELTRRRALDMK